MTAHRDDDVEEWSATLEGARAGSSAAFEAIFLELSAPVAGYLRASAIRDVEGVTNEVFLQALQGLPRFKGSWTAFRSWVFTIAHHRMVDEVRRASRRPTIVPMDDAVLGPTGDVELDALDALSESRLRALLAGLSIDQRSVLLLRVVADLPLAEVARTLDKSVGAVKALQHRALANLRKALETEQADA